MKITTIDVSQAFVCAPETNPHMYMQLPRLPPELQGADLGRGAGSGFVVHMHRNIYGLKQAGRVWQQHLMKWMIETLGARLYVTDRCVFEWEWQGHKMRGVIHVDDVLFAVSSDVIRAEFVRRVAADFGMTGGIDEATIFCGIGIRRDWKAQTVTMHQEDFAKEMVKKYNLAEEKVETMPYKVSHARLVPWDGEATPRSQFDYMMFVGDLNW